MYTNQTNDPLMKCWFKGNRSPPVRVLHVQSIGETVSFAAENFAYA